MDETKPTGTETKVKTSKAEVVGNDDFGRNAVNGYWLREFGGPQRIVCAETTVYAIAPGDVINVGLHTDKPYFEATVVPRKADATAAAGTGARAFTARWTGLDVVAQTDVSVQFNPAAPGAVLLYDSVEALSSFTYVTIAPPPVIGEEEL